MQEWERCWLTRNKKTTFDIFEFVGKRTATSRGFVGKVLKDCIKVGYIMLLNNIYWRYPTIISKIKSHTPFGRPLKQQQTIKCGLDDGSCQDDWKQARGTIRKANWLPLIFFDPTKPVKLWSPSIQLTWFLSPHTPACTQGWWLCGSWPRKQIQNTCRQNVHYKDRRDVAPFTFWSDKRSRSPPRWDFPKRQRCKQDWRGPTWKHKRFKLSLKTFIW